MIIRNQAKRVRSSEAPRNYEQAENKLFLTSWPNGELRRIEILANSPTIKNDIYARYVSGDTNTTYQYILFDIPEGI